MSERRTISIVIPLYNEEEVLPKLVEAIELFRQARPDIVEVVLVDDGSSDGSAELVKDLAAQLDGYTLVRFSRNFGQQLAITAGLRAARGDAAVVMDADLQDPIEVIDEMVEKWQEGADVVYGVRRSRRPDGVAKRNASTWFYKVFARTTGLNAPENAGDFRLLSRPVLDAYNRLGEHQPYVRGLTSWLGFDQVGVEYDRMPRAAGSTKYPWRKMLQLAFDSITAFSDKPLKVAVRLGFIISFLSAVGLIWVVAVKLFTDSAIPGWASLLFASFFFGGLQLFFLGIFGAYIARVYDEVKGRPRYVTREIWTSMGENVERLPKTTTQ